MHTQLYRYLKQKFSTLFFFYFGPISVMANKSANGKYDNKNASRIVFLRRRCYKNKRLFLTDGKIHGNLISHACRFFFYTVCHPEKLQQFQKKKNCRKVNRINIDSHVSHHFRFLGLIHVVIINKTLLALHKRILQYIHGRWNNDGGNFSHGKNSVEA